MVAQVSVQGFVKEHPSGHTVPYATVSVLNTDSALVTGAITDDNGFYSCQVGKGTYILQVSYVGYNTANCLFSVSKNTTLEDIYITETTSELKELEVKATRPLIERQMDKLVLNVSQSAFAVGHSGQDILRKAPGVNIDKDGNVTVNGKSVEVYIDGRPSYMSGEQLRGLLMGTDASTIEKIEIITNPSSKYEAAGQGGIINIKLKKNKSKGLNGTLSANYAGMYFRDVQQYVQNDFVTLGLNYRGEKTYTSLSLTQVYAKQSVSLNSQSQMPIVLDGQTFDQKSISQTDYGIGFQYYNMRVSNDFYINPKNTLGFILNVPIMKFGIDMQGGNQSQVSLWQGTSCRDTLQDISTQGQSSNYSPQHTANINYTHTFNDSLSRELTANIDYNRYANGESNEQQNGIRINKTGLIVPQELNIQTQQIINIYSAKVDFQTAFWKTGMLECGAKWALSNTANRMTMDSVMTASYRRLDTTDYDYAEHVAAVYISASKQFNQHWNAKIGLRGELTSATGYYHQSNQYDTVHIKPYFNLFPTAFVGYSPNKDWNMNISYTRRIKRASYYQLNPFVNYLNAHTYTCGNPNLQPEFNHQVDMNFAYSRYVSLGFNFAHTQGMQNQRVQIQSNGDIMRTWVNFGTCTTHGGNLSLTELPLVPKFQRDSSGAYVRNEKGKRTFNEAWLTLTLNANAYHFINKATNDPTYGTQKQWYSSFYACLTAYLPKDCQLSLDGSWSSPCVNGYSEWSGYYDMNIAFKKQFLQKRLTLTIKVDDLLNSMYFGSKEVGLAEGYYSEVSQHVRAHSVGVGLTYIFGQQQYHKWRKVGNVEESSRLGGSGNNGIGGK